MPEAAEGQDENKSVDPYEFELEGQQIRLIRRQALDAREKAYCPYSNFKVGCCIVLKDGRTFTGANIENASYPVGTCAERVALGIAVVEGVRYGDIKAVAVATYTPSGQPASPCGMCRQFMREFCEPKMPVLLVDSSQHYETITFEELLPMSFGPEFLQVNAMKKA